MFKEINVNDVVRPHYDGGWRLLGLKVPDNFLAQVSMDDTYITIFGPDQGEQEKFFNEQFKDWIIFKSEKAINIRYSRVVPRNTVYVYEKPL